MTSCVDVLTAGWMDTYLEIGAKGGNNPLGVIENDHDAQDDAFG